MNPLRAELEKHTWPWNYEACEVVPSPLGSKIGDLSALAIGKNMAESG